MNPPNIPAPNVRIARNCDSPEVKREVARVALYLVLILAFFFGSLVGFLAGLSWR